MAVTTRALVSAKQAENVETTQYTAPAATRVIIDKFTGTNTTGAAATTCFPRMSCSPYWIEYEIIE